MVLYHKISPAGAVVDDLFSTPVDVFEAQMAWLASNGYKTLTLAEVEARIGGAPNESDREIAITFDDGYSCLAERAAPVLANHGFTAAAFLITSRIGNDDDYLTWDQARSISGNGPIEFRTHTHNHQKWPFGTDTAEQITEELSTSTQILVDQLGLTTEELRQIAWPYGRTCDAWDTAARQGGIPTQFVVQRGAITHQGQYHRLPRILVDGMSAKTFQRWVTALGNPLAAPATNLVFGAIRERRQGAGYR